MRKKERASYDVVFMIRILNAIALDRIKNLTRLGGYLCMDYNNTTRCVKKLIDEGLIGNDGNQFYLTLDGLEWYQKNPFWVGESLKSSYDAR